MARQGWKRLVASASWQGGVCSYPIDAYSEFMPPPRLGIRAYGGQNGEIFDRDDPHGWLVSEYEENVELRPGLAHFASHLIVALDHLGHGRPLHGIARAKLEGNPYWPPELAERAGSLPHERYMVMMPLALSRTQDDKGRVRWTLFGGSEQGPEQGFWKSFFTAPDREMPVADSLGFVRQLLQEAYGETSAALADLRRLGFRILPTETSGLFSYWRPQRLPQWTETYLLKPREPISRVRYLLTFRPFGELPVAVQRSYLAGDLHLLPFPGSLVFWGVQAALRLQGQLPLAMQIPLLNLFERYEGHDAIRVPQSGWLHEPHPDLPEPETHHGPLRNTYRRTHRWQRIQRHDDPLAVSGREDRVAHVLFSTAAADVGLYDKPMARNAQIWTRDSQLVLDGPRAGRAELAHAAETLREGGQFGYRFYFPPMQVGAYEVFWHRPLVAYRAVDSGAAKVVPCAPTGYLTAYRAERPNLAAPVELWPRILRREIQQSVLPGFALDPQHHAHRLAVNVRKFIHTWSLLGERPLPGGFARALLTLPRQWSLEDWLRHVEQWDGDVGAGRWLAEELQGRLAAPREAAADWLPQPLTFNHTARRSFEVAYWRTIARLATGKFINKDNADCAHDPITQLLRRRGVRDLPALGDYLLGYYRRLIDEYGLTGRAVAGDLPFRWQTAFDFPWMGGWRENQEDKAEERNLLIRIPGRDRRRAVIMADHYDTAYMEDVYDRAKGGSGARLSAAGADDNHSATAALMLGAPIFLQLSRAGALDCDVWLVHLTGEEFPSDCMGARHLAQAAVERRLKLRVAGRRPIDLAQTIIQGVYVLDMVAHNNDRDRDVFQISPGVGRESMWLAYQAQLANAIWNARAPQWNQRPARRGKSRGRRSADPAKVPGVAAHPVLQGEVRVPIDPRSSLFNTDGQIFSDAGIPVVLFMENYDINRSGYHDTHDTMANIDLDYGAAVAAIAIEAVARAATQKPGEF